MPRRATVYRGHFRYRLRRGGVRRSNHRGGRSSEIGVLVISPPVRGACGFDGDRDTGTDADIEAFFACLGGNCCGMCFTGGADFDGDGDVGTDADIEAFFRVLGGGPC